MTTQPYVALRAGDVDLGALARVDARALGTAEELIESSLMSHRLLVINHVKNELSKVKRLTGSVLLKLADDAGELYLSRMTSVAGPAVAETYLAVYRGIGADDVPVSTIYALADDHTKRIGRYFHETSREGLLQAFNTYTNRQVPNRVAADKALDAFGLTPRQISGYTSLDTTQKIASSQSRSVTARATEYVSRSVRQRLRGFSEQETHNISEQAKQTAWAWLQQNGRLTEAAEKVWITAKDERTCSVCAPMNGARVPITERFELPNGMKVWVAGVHPNCRCEVKVVDLGLNTVIGKSEKWYETEEKRNSSGQFAETRDWVAELQRAREQKNRTRQDQAMAMQAIPESEQVLKPESRKKTWEEMTPAERQLAARSMKVDQDRARAREKNTVSRAEFQRMVAEKVRENKRRAAYEALADRLEQTRERTTFRPLESGVELQRPERTERVRLDIPTAVQLDLPQEKVELDLPPATEVADLAAEAAHTPTHATAVTTEMIALEQKLESLLPEEEQSFSLDLSQLSAKLDAISAPMQRMVRPVGIDGGVFRIVGPNESMEEAGQYQFSGTPFAYGANSSSSLQWAVISAENARRQVMQEKYNEITDHGILPGTFTVKDEQFGDLEARISPMEMRRVIEMIAAESVDGIGARDTRDEYMQVDLYDPNTDIWYDYDDETGAGHNDGYTGSEREMATTKMSYRDIGAQFGLDPDDFRFRVLHIDTVHDERGGRGAAQHFSGTKSGNEYFAIDGAYEVEDVEYEQLTDENIGVDVHILKPYDPAWGNPDENE